MCTLCKGGHCRSKSFSKDHFNGPAGLKWEMRGDGGGVEPIQLVGPRQRQIQEGRIQMSEVDGGENALPGGATQLPSPLLIFKSSL